jgi:hypothetical protein
MDGFLPGECRPVFTTASHAAIETVFLNRPAVHCDLELMALRIRLRALPMRIAQLLYSTSDNYGMLYILDPPVLPLKFLVHGKLVMSASLTGLAIKYLDPAHLSERLYKNPPLYVKYKTIDEPRFLRQASQGKSKNHLPSYTWDSEWLFVSTAPTQRLYVKDNLNATIINHTQTVTYAHGSPAELARIKETVQATPLDTTLRGCAWAGCLQPPRAQLSKCSACMRVHYCSKLHQKLDYSSHKHACPTLLNRNISDFGNIIK